MKEFYKDENRKKLKHVFDNYFNHTKKTKFILVGGTNGKGTTSNFLKQLIEINQKKCGLLLSPHVCFVNERIKVGDNYIKSIEIHDIVNKYIDVFIKYELSFFEINLFIALELFSVKDVEYAVLEVGIGGQYDACNIVEPICSALTNVTFDHQEMLGNTIEKITKTKVGIARKNKNLFVGETISQVAKKVILEQETINQYNSIFVEEKKSNGKNREANFNLAYLVASTIFPKSKINKNSFSEMTDLPSRLSTVKMKNKKVVIDGAHNEDSIVKLIDGFSSSDYCDIFIAIKKDKNVKKMLDLVLASRKFTRVFLVNLKEEWAVKWSNIILNNEDNNLFFLDYEKMFMEIMNSPSTRIIICGSFYFCGKILKDLYIEKHHKKGILEVNINEFFQNELKTI